MQTYAVPRSATKETVTTQNHLWICDVSYSMVNNIGRMTEDVIAQLDHCLPNDVLTILWFSSEGMRGVIVKGAVVGENKQMIANLIRQQMYARNLTCFSESLQDSIGHISDLASLNLPWSLFWFTDGHPVVSNYAREIEAIFKALSQLRVLVANATIVGYGDYYNRELLLRMAGALGAGFVHADDMTAFQGGMFRHLGYRAEPRVPLQVQSDAEFVFGISTGKLVTYPVEGGKAFVPLSESEVYSYQPRTNGTKRDDKSAEPDKPKLYALALLHGREGRVDQALEILGRDLGDVYLVNALTSAFTNAEVGAALNAIEAAIFDETARLVAGYKKNAVPKRDAFCLIEALELLEQDPEAFFVPDQGFVYRRIGVATKQADDAPQFIRIPGQRIPIKLTWHGKRLNLSILAEIDGYVTVDDNCLAVGLTNPEPAKQYRNYTIIKDGVLNVAVLPVAMSKASFDILRKGGLIKKTAKWQAHKIYELDLRRIPIMNRAMADSVTATDLAALARQELTCEAALKVLRYLRNVLDPDKEQVESEYTPEQREYLKGFHVDYRGWFSPPVVEGEIIDWYDARTFEIKIKGASSLPKVDDVIKRGSSGAAMNTVQKLMYDLYTSFNGSPLDKIDEYIKSYQRLLRELRHQINHGRAAVILGNRWLPEFEDRDDNKLVAPDDMEFTFHLGTQRVPF